MKVRPADLTDPHWDTSSGPGRPPSPQPLLHAYIEPRRAIDAGIRPVPADRGAKRIKVCIVVKDNSRSLIANLLEQAGPRPT